MGQVELEWRKASFSATNGNCVEVAVAFRKAASSATNGQCVEVGTCACATVYVRDSKDPEGSVLEFTVPEWSAFVAGVVAGEFGG